MARTLPATISNAIPTLGIAEGAQPSVAIGASDLMRRLYQQTVMSTQGRSAALITSAGTLLRAAIYTAAGDPNPVMLYRITSMSTTSQWLAAGTSLYANGDSRAGVALAQTGSTIRLFFVDHTSQSTYYRDSTDDGVTWSAATLLKIKPTVSSVTYLVCTGIAALSITDIEANWYVYSWTAGAILRTYYTAGAWTAWAVPSGPTNPNVGVIQGWTCDPSQGTTAVYVGGTQMRQGRSGIAATSSTFTIGTSTWATAFNTIHPMDTATNGLSLAYPAVHWDATSALWWCGVNLKDDGTISLTVDSRTLILNSPDGIHWTAVQMLYGSMWGEVHILFSGGVAYIFDNQWLYTAPAAAASTGMETDLLQLTISEKIGHPQQFTLVFANDQGQWNNQPYLRDNAQLAIYLGYNGTTIQTHTCFIDAVEYTVAGTSAILTVHGRCIQKFLDQVQMLFSAYTSQTLATIVTGVIGPNIPLATLPTTSQFSQILASFSIIPGQTRAEAMKRLADVFQFDMFSTTLGGLKIVERAASDTSVWSYNQEHLGAAFQQNADQPNVVRVIGAPTSSTYTNVFADAVDHTAVNQSGVYRYRHIVDRLLDTSAKCQIKANLALRDDQTQANTAAMTVTINPAHELLDVITLTEPRLGLTNQNLRIKEIATHIDFQTGQWEQHLALDLP